MSEAHIQSGLAAVNGAQIYYETAGAEQPFVMIHAGVADRRQWNNEFGHFSKQYLVLRYDMRGYGKSEPVDGEFTNLADLVALLDFLDLRQPLVLMGCSMGGGLAIDFALAHPARTKTVILVGSSPSGLGLDVADPPIFQKAEKAYNAKDWDLLAELETKAWFDGMNRTPDQVDQTMRQLAYEMNRTALAHEAKGLGKRLPNIQPPAGERLNELTLPILAITGANDIPYLLATADYLEQHIPSVRKVIIDNAAHLLNMDQPAEFQHVVTDFLDQLPA
jgi:pimeloyl-ACP methyl ester carboxylesterase